MASGAYTHMHEHTHTQIHLRIESDFKISGVRWPAAGACLV